MEYLWCVHLPEVEYIITGCFYCSSISSPGGDNLFFPDSAGPHFPPSHSSTPTSPFPSTVIPDENVLLEAVTNELGVDSTDPSLLNMSDLLSLLQPDSDPLDQLALTIEEASSDMIVLQQSDGMNVYLRSLLLVLLISYSQLTLLVMKLKKILQ